MVKRAFISFDFDHDEDLRTLLAGQAKNPDTPFDFSDWSIKEHLQGDWKEKVRAKIRKADLTIVICGEHTDAASGVSIELDLTREEKKPYFLLRGRAEKTCRLPRNGSSEKMYRWTWDNLKALVNGNR